MGYDNWKTTGPVDECLGPEPDFEFERIVKAEVHKWLEANKPAILEQFSRQIAFADLLALARVN